MDENKVYTVIGLMSGTSLDGVDAALLKTDGKMVIETIDFISEDYDERHRAKLRKCFGMTDMEHPDVGEAERLITYSHIDIVEKIMNKNGLSAEKVDVIGFHGQTITHNAKEKISIQIGNGALLAKQTGIDVVCDFRSKDVEMGGQGAPLLPLYHRAKLKASLLNEPCVVVNIGGVSNVTWIGKGENDIMAFDTGPGNALIDDFVSERTGEPFDKDGVSSSTRCGSRGSVRQRVMLP